MKDFLSLAADRYSVRKFKNEPVRQSDIDAILKAGHLAPTACNNQPQRILVINTPEALEKLGNATKCRFGCSLAMLICYEKNESWKRKFDGKDSGDIDASIVATHMMLAGHDIGVGSTWVMYFDPDKMRAEFNIPESIEPTALLVMGYPADDAPINPLHSTFRPEEELVKYGSF